VGSGKSGKRCEKDSERVYVIACACTALAVKLILCQAPDRKINSIVNMGKSAKLGSTEEPVDSVELVGQHAMKMGWLEKEAEESMLGGWSKR
jgi:hypothetical protein